MENNLTFEDKKKILDFLCPYMQADKISLRRAKQLLYIDDIYELVELGYPAKLWTEEELKEEVRKGLERK